MGLHVNEYRIELLPLVGPRHVSRRLTNIIRVEVRTAAGALATIYSDPELTALTNPITSISSNGFIKCFSAQATLTFVIYLNNGKFVVLEDIAPTGAQKLVLIPDAFPFRVFKIPFGVSDNVETDTLVDLPRGFVVTDSWIEVTTLEAGKTLKVGLLSTETGGNASGFLDAVSMAAVGAVRGTVTVTVGANNTYIASDTWGALLATLVAGEDIAAGGDGAWIPLKYVVTTATSVTYTGSAGTTAAVGFIYIAGYQYPYDPSKSLGTA